MLIYEEPVTRRLWRSFPSSRVGNTSESDWMIAETRSVEYV